VYLNGKHLIGKQVEMRSLERPRNHPDGGKMLKWILKKWEWRKEAECV